MRNQAAWPQVKGWRVSSCPQTEELAEGIICFLSPTLPSIQTQATSPSDLTLSSQTLLRIDSPVRLLRRRPSVRTHLSSTSRPGHSCGHSDRTPAAGPRRLPGRALWLRLPLSRTVLDAGSRQLGERTINLNYGPAPSRRPLIGSYRMVSMQGHA